MLGFARKPVGTKEYDILNELNPFTIGFAKSIDSFTPSVKFSGCTKNKANTNILLTGNSINESKLPRQYYTSMESVLESPGYYAWIIFADKSFAAAKTFSNAEIFSKHGDLYNLTPKPVIAAGECRVDEEKNVVYNFESGTFMGDIHSDYMVKYPGAILSYDQFYHRHIGPMWTKAGAKSVTMDPAPQGMIRYGVKMNPANICKYRNAGFTVRKFKSKKNCNTYNLARSKHRYASRTNSTLGNFNTVYASLPQKNRVPYEPYSCEGGRKKTRKSHRRNRA